jgi:hypothetical protein
MPPMQRNPVRSGADRQRAVYGTRASVRSFDFERRYWPPPQRAAQSGSLYWRYGDMLPDSAVNVEVGVDQ